MQVEHPEYIIIMLFLLSFTMIVYFVVLKYWVYDPKEKEKLLKK